MINYKMCYLKIKFVLKISSLLGVIVLNGVKLIFKFILYVIRGEFFYFILW